MLDKNQYFVNLLKITHHISFVSLRVPQLELYRRQLDGVHFMQRLQPKNHCYGSFFLGGGNFPHINPLGHKWRACFQKMSLASDFLVLELKQIMDTKFENQPISGFCYLRVKHFGLWRAVKIKSRHIEHFFF